jgi:hypothetical protein
MDMRIVIKHTSNGNSVVDMMDLEKGDIFTLKESDEVIVGKYKADGNPYRNKDGIATIVSIPI